MSTLFDQRAQAPMIQVHRIWTTYEQDPADPAKMREIDMVSFGPVGAKERSVITDRIVRLQKLQPAEKGAENPAVAFAHYTWNMIKPHYEAYKAGRAPTIEGTPISAWNAISPEQAEVLRLNGIHTVEAVANLTDSHVMRFGIPGLQKLIPAALGFLASSDTTRTAAALAEKDEQIASLKSQMEDLAEMVRASMRAAAPADELTADETNDDEVLEAAPRTTRRR